MKKVVKKQDIDGEDYLGVELKNISSITLNLTAREGSNSGLQFVSHQWADGEKLFVLEPDQRLSYVFRYLPAAANRIWSFYPDFSITG